MKFRVVCEQGINESVNQTIGNIMIRIVMIMNEKSKFVGITTELDIFHELNESILV